MLDLLTSAWTAAYTLALALFLFGLTVFVHEFGHFIVARWCGLKILTFSIGFGKAIAQWEWGGIIYKIGWIPFGGYVALPQLDPSGMEKIQGKEEESGTETGGEADGLPPISPWKKIAVSVSGPLGNILFAVILAWAIFLASDKPILEETAAVIGQVEESSAAYQAGIRPGNTVIAVNGKAVNSWYDFAVESLLGETENSVELTLLSSNGTQAVSVELGDLEKTGQVVPGVDPAVPCLIGAVSKGSPAERAGLKANDVIVQFSGVEIIGWSHFTDLVQKAPLKEVSVVVNRSGRDIPLFLTPEYNAEYERNMIGVSLGSFRVRPMDQLKSDASMIVRVLQGLVSPQESKKVAKNLQGPVGIFSMLMMAIQAGLWTTLGLIRLININLALLNLLPIPVLDGGHIVFSLWEGITRRKVNAKMQMILVNLCAVLLIFAMLLITFNDLDRRLHIKEFFGRLIPGQSESE
jgi:regulator of sigma E protease